jgi:hypothetical protein
LYVYTVYAVFTNNGGYMTKDNNKPKTLAEALIEFKKQDIEIFKQSVNPHFKSKYADLATILEAIEVPVAELGVLITSHSHFEGGQWVETTVLEFGAESMPSSFPLFGGDAQKMGSSITYARRFNLQSLLNLAAVDDDGSEAAKGKKLEKTFDAMAVFKDLLGNVIEKAATPAALDSNWKVRSQDINKLKKDNEGLYNQLVDYAKARKEQVTQPTAE